MKALELMNDIDAMLTEISRELHRPVGKSLLQHFQDVKSHSSGCLRSVRSSQIQQLANMYHLARYSGETFSKKEYEKFLEVANNIIAVISQQPQNFTTTRRLHNKSSLTKKKVLQWQESVQQQQSSDNSVFAPLVENVEMGSVAIVTTTPQHQQVEQLHGIAAGTDSNTLESASDSVSFSNLNLSFEQSSSVKKPLLSRRHSRTKSEQTKV